MEYSNPKIREEINYSKENPLKKFLLLIVGIFFVPAVFVVGVNLLTQSLAHHIPFRYETKLMPAIEKMLINEEEEDKNHLSRQQYLENLTLKLAKKIALPEEIKLHIHYLNDATINAGATLNGNILIFRDCLIS